MAYIINLGGESSLNLELIKLINKHYLEFPFCGARSMHTWLTMDMGYQVSRNRIERPNQVWAIDITYIPMPKGFMYLTVVIDLYSRYDVNWSMS